MFFPQLQISLKKLSWTTGYGGEPRSKFSHNFPRSVQFHKHSRFFLCWHGHGKNHLVRKKLPGFCWQTQRILWRFPPVELSSVLSNSCCIPSGIASFYVPTICIGSARILTVSTKKSGNYYQTVFSTPTLTHGKKPAVLASIEQKHFQKVATEFRKKIFNRIFYWLTN